MNNFGPASRPLDFWRQFRQSRATSTRSRPRCPRLQWQRRVAVRSLSTHYLAEKGANAGLGNTKVRFLPCGTSISSWQRLSSVLSSVRHPNWPVSPAGVGMRGCHRSQGFHGEDACFSSTRRGCLANSSPTATPNSTGKQARSLRVPCTRRGGRRCWAARLTTVASERGRRYGRGGLGTLCFAANLAGLPRGRRAQLSQEGSSAGSGETGEDRHGAPALLPRVVMAPVTSTNVRPEDRLVLFLGCSNECVSGGEARSWVGWGGS